MWNKTRALVACLFVVKCSFFQEIISIFLFSWRHLLKLIPKEKFIEKFNRELLLFFWWKAVWLRDPFTSPNIFVVNVNWLTSILRVSHKYMYFYPVYFLTTFLPGFNQINLGRGFLFISWPLYITCITEILPDLFYRKCIALIIYAMRLSIQLAQDATNICPVFNYI